MSTNKMASKPAFYFNDGPYLQTLQGLYNALSAPEAFVKLLGPARSGKSSVCEKLSKYLKRKDYSVIYFRGAIESPDMLRSMLSRELDLPDSSNFPRLLEDALADKGDKPLILLFDDAHLLTDITLLEIYRLAEVQIEHQRVLNVVLCGESPLEKRLLSNQEFKSMLLQVSHRFVLEPMDAEALAQFFYKYADYSGIPGLQLEQSAMSYFYKSCKGYPGPARDMCRLMVEARLGENQLLPITRNELTEWFKAAADNQMLPSGQSQNSSKFGALMPLAAVVAIASLGFLYQQVQSPDDTVAAEIAAANIPQTIRPQPSEASVSPFSESSTATEDIAAEPEPAAAATDSANQVSFVPADIPEPVSDSSLSLVTAQERGVNTDIIVEPEFETMQESESDAEDAAAAEESIAVAEDSVEENLAQQVEIGESAQIQPESVALAGEEDSGENTDTISGTTAGPTTDNIADTEEQAEEIARADEPVARSEEALDNLLDDSILDKVQSEEIVSTENVQIAATDPAVEEVVEINVPQESANLALNVDTPESQQTSLPGIEELEAAVAVWVEAWQNKELEGYFASYHSGFVPRYQDSQAAWRSNRRRVIGNAPWIRLEMSEFEFIGVDAGMMEVHFWLSYESPTYSDNTQKKLLLVEEGGEWRIMEEINLQVRS